jgi:hypothetical protein
MPYLVLGKSVGSLSGLLGPPPGNAWLGKAASDQQASGAIPSWRGDLARLKLPPPTPRSRQLAGRCPPHPRNNCGSGGRDNHRQLFRICYSIFKPSIPPTAYAQHLAFPSVLIAMARTRAQRAAQRAAQKPPLSPALNIQGNNLSPLGIKSRKSPTRKRRRIQEQPAPKRAEGTRRRPSTFNETPSAQVCLLFMIVSNRNLTVYSSHQYPLRVEIANASNLSTTRPSTAPTQARSDSGHPIPSLPGARLASQRLVATTPHRPTRSRSGRTNGTGQRTCSSPKTPRRWFPP